MCQRRSQSHGSDLPLLVWGWNSWVADLHREDSYTAQPWGYLIGPPLELLRERGQEEQGRVSGSSV